MDKDETKITKTSLKQLFIFLVYSVERILSIFFVSIFVLGYYMYRPVLAHAHRNGQLLYIACHHIMNMHDGN